MQNRGLVGALFVFRFDAECFFPGRFHVDLLGFERVHVHVQTEFLAPIIFRHDALSHAFHVLGERVAFPRNGVAGSEAHHSMAQVVVHAVDLAIGVVEKVIKEVGLQDAGCDDSLQRHPETADL